MLLKVRILRHTCFYYVIIIYLFQTIQIHIPKINRNIKMKNKQNKTVKLLKVYFNT